MSSNSTVSDKLAALEAQAPATEPAPAPQPEPTPRNKGGRPPGTKNGQGKTSPKAAAKKPTPARVQPAGMPPTRAPVAPKKAETEPVQDLRDSYKGLWDLVAGMFDDVELRISDAEADEWAAPMARTLEQYGQSHQTKKLAPLAAVGVTVKHAAPRIKRISAAQAEKAKERKGPPPAFRRGPVPPNGQDRAPADPSNNGIVRDGGIIPLG